MRVDGMDATFRMPEPAGERFAMQQNAAPAAPIAETGAPVGSVAADPKTNVEQQHTGAVSDRLVRMAIDKANKQMQARETALQFEPYDKTGDMIVRIIDTNTKEVIREIPSKKILDMMANMLEMAGILVDERR